MNPIDLNNPPSHHKLDLSIRPEETVGERRVRLFKDAALFVMASGFVVLIVYVCFETVLAGSSSADEKKWAMSVLSAAAAGLTGYLVRK